MEPKSDRASREEAIRHLQNEITKDKGGFFSARKKKLREELDKLWRYERI